MAGFAESQPHAAYCAFTHGGLSSRWMFVSWTVPFDSQPLEDVIRQLFIPTLSGCPPPCDNLQQLFALPARWGGLGIFIPTNTSNNELAASRLLLSLFICAFMTILRALLRLFLSNSLENFL